MVKPTPPTIDMANRITFDPSEDPTPDMMAAEQAALEQGEKLVNAQQEDKARLFEQADAEAEDVSLIGGKFKSQDDLLKAYNELQSKLGKSEPEEEEEPSEEPTEAPEETAEEEVEEVSEPVRQFLDIAERYESNGGMSEDDIESLSQMDSKQLVETYFKYQTGSGATNQIVAPLPLLRL